MFKQCKWILTGVACLLASAASAQTDTYFGGWMTDTIAGRITNDPASPFSYLASVQNRAYNAPGAMNQLNLSGSTYYNFTPVYRVSFGSGLQNAFYPFATGGTEEFRLTQTFEIDLRENSYYFLISRLEERTLLGNSQISVRFRPRAVMQIPWQKFSLVMFDEVIVNLNEPDWVNPNFFNQNRAFVGVQFPILKNRSALLVGYMNRYVLGMNNRRITDHLITVDVLFTGDFFYW